MPDSKKKKFNCLNSDNLRKRNPSFEETVCVTAINIEADRVKKLTHFDSINKHIFLGKLLLLNFMHAWGTVPPLTLSKNIQFIKHIYKGNWYSQWILKMCSTIHKRKQNILHKLSQIDIKLNIKENWYLVQ